ncbi:MAG: hypothetical protein QOF62_2474 [Pyrinomonadaceae bacterium]|jgi:hypothetical protein|nr:hypothetical protein [Pyrinomonadaceae bacterium]
MKSYKTIPVLIALFLSVSANAQMANPVRPLPGVFPRTSQASPTRDGSLMKPAHRAYEDAMEFARTLTENGIKVFSVHKSKLDGFFPGIEKAAFFRTEKGVVEVIFFPDPRGAENVIVKEQRQAGRYLYSFAGQPNLAAAGGFDSSRPMYFLMRRNWFIVPDTEELYKALKSALKRE